MKPDFVVIYLSLTLPPQPSDIKLTESCGLIPIGYILSKLWLQLWFQISYERPQWAFSGRPMDHLFKVNIQQVNNFMKSPVLENSIAFSLMIKFWNAVKAQFFCWLMPGKIKLNVTCRICVDDNPV